MPGKQVYEYAVIRVVPRVEREEFINVGIILFSKDAKYLKARYELNEEKLRLFSSELEIESLHESMRSFDKICMGDSSGGSIATMDIPERFRWLTAIRSTSVQTSRPQTGFSSDMDATLHRLYQELVL